VNFFDDSSYLKAKSFIETKVSAMELQGLNLKRDNQKTLRDYKHKKPLNGACFKRIDMYFRHNYKNYTLDN
jgi:hypothetical protein